MALITSSSRCNMVASMALSTKATHPGIRRCPPARIQRLTCVSSPPARIQRLTCVSSPPARIQRLTCVSSLKEPLGTDPSSSTGSPVRELVANPNTAATCLAGFSLVAAGVFLPSSSSTTLARSAMQLLAADGGTAQAATATAAASERGLTVAPQLATAAIEPLTPGLLLSLDQAVHSFVTSNTSASFRALAADIVISDSFICAGIAGWVLCTAACLLRAPKKTAGPLALAWGFYLATCGAVGQGDPPLVDWLKHSFGRVRPSALHHTFSFPSGHTSAAVFIVGALVMVLLPLTMQAATEDSTSAQGKQCISSSSSRNSDSPRSGSLSSFDVATLATWGAAWVTTASGRVLADAHWVTDTLAGGLLGVSVVSCLAWCIRHIEQGTSSSSSSKAAAEDTGF